MTNFRQELVKAGFNQPEEKTLKFITRITQPTDASESIEESAAKILSLQTLSYSERYGGTLFFARVPIRELQESAFTSRGKIIQ